MVTDYLLGIVCTFLGLKLFKKGKSHGSKSILFWSMAFFATGLAAYLGGTYHGFHEVMSVSKSAWIWKGTVYCIGLISLAMLAGSIKALVPVHHQKWLLSLMTGKFAVYCIWMINHDDFSYVIYDYVPSMIGILLLHLFDMRKNKNTESLWIILGIISSLLGAFLQQKEFSIHTHFNHNDIYHVIQMISMFLFYQGASHLKDRA